MAVVVLALAACDSATTTTGPTTTTSSTTTTIVDDNCELVAADTVAFLNTLILALDDTRLAEFLDKEAWPDDLRDTERSGMDLDLRVAALGCDPKAIQQQALNEANLIPGGPLSEGLLNVLLTSPSTTTPTTPTTTAEVVETTGGTADETSGGDAPTTTSSGTTPQGG